ncbi:MAG: Bifunctional protein Aas [Chlamydiae bacterium]|nr:Bifunctional protein Aas [Chlamydiota bacterium]
MIRLLPCVRYKVKSVGLDRITKQETQNDGGILFLPNHTAEVDPILVSIALWKNFQPRPMIVEWIIQLPVVSILMKLMGAVPIPDFDDKSSQKRRLDAENAFISVVEGLKKKDNFIVYPSGRLKNSEKEVLGGASGVYKILQANKNVNIVLVRTTGLWGSRFSRGWNGKKVIFLDAVLHSLKAILKNGIFFVPKRKVLIEFEPVNSCFPWEGSRFEINSYLESWYNQKRDHLTLVPYQFWSNKIKGRLLLKSSIVDVSHVPEEIKQDIRVEIAKITKSLYTEIKPQMNLFSDLRLDPLDIQEIANYLERQYKVKKIKPSQLTTVASVMNYAAQPNDPSVKNDEITPSSSQWAACSQSQKTRASILKQTIPEAFFAVACQRKKDLACADLLSSEVTYERLMLGVILLSKKIQKMPGEYVGVMLPASTTVNVIIMACQVAKKIPVMINWTVGKKHLESVIKQTDLKCIISSKAFLRNIADIDLSLVEDKIVHAESLKKEISFIDKLKAYFMIKLSYNQICKLLAINNLDKNKVAALIFTSGTETMPKGVPLSHENIISNLGSAFDRVKTSNHDVMLGFLPPFHSFGLTVTGLLPLISGVRAIYYPNPTHYKKLGKLVAQWQVTFLCGAPTFIKGILQPSHRELFKTVRYVVTGAEKAPQSLIDRVADVCPQADFLEGYGLSECGPILSLNVPGEKHQGVGPALDIVDFLIVHPDSLLPMPQGQKGHILAHGPNIFAGYMGDFPSPFVEIDGKKWFKTGDLGYLDHRNYLTIAGRLKRQVKVGGEIVNLNALEDSLTRALIQEKIIPTGGEDQPALAICAKEGDGRAQLYLFATFDSKPEDINKKIKKLGFSNLHKIHQVVKCEKLPLMASGKIHYRKLEENL